MISCCRRIQLQLEQGFLQLEVVANLLNDKIGRERRRLQITGRLATIEQTVTGHHVTPIGNESDLARTRKLFRAYSLCLLSSAPGHHLVVTDRFGHLFETDPRLAIGVNLDMAALVPLDHDINSK